MGKSKNEKRAVLVTDIHRGVYFGYLVEELEGGKAVVLENARHAWYWRVDASNHPGIYGLTSGGPAKGSKIGARFNGKIRDVSKIIDVKPEAVARWESQGWD